MERVDRERGFECETVLAMRICKNDEILVNVGKTTYGGKVYHLSGSSIVLLSNNQLISIKVNKINSLILKSYDGVSNAEGTNK